MKLPDSLVADPLFSFDKKWHSFKYGRRRLVSVTKWMKRFKNEFDAEYWSTRKAEEEGVTPEEIKQRWADKRDRSFALGQLVHNGIDSFLRGEGVPPELWRNDEAAHRMALFHNLMDTRLSKARCVASELPVFCPKLGYAGFIDCILQLENGKLYIGDWKTSEKFKHGNSGFDYLKPPFDSLKENDLNVFSLQVSLLRILLERHKVKVDGAFIVHLPPPPAVEAIVHFPPDIRSFVMKSIEQS